MTRKTAVSSPTIVRRVIAPLVSSGSPTTL
jgi:hypothetical protein